MREVLEKFQVPGGFSEFFDLAGPKQKTIRCLGGSGGTGRATHRPKRIFRSEMHFKHDLPHDVESGRDAQDYQVVDLFGSLD